MKSRQFTFSEAVLMPFAVITKDSEGVETVTDMTTAGYSLTLYVLRDGEPDAEEYSSDDASRVTWENQAGGTGYWTFTEAESVNQSIWKIGTNKVDLWFESSSPPRHLGSAEITIVESATGGNP